jgi:integrase
MPRPPKGPRLYLHAGKWIIRDGNVTRRTGLGADQAAAAEQKLAEYIAGKWRPVVDQAGNPKIRDVVMTYAEHQIPHRPNGHRKRELAAQCARLVSALGDHRVSDINGALCRYYAEQSSTPSMARHDLEIARAAVNHWRREHGLAVMPAFTLPAKGKPRSGHLSRFQAAALLWHAHRAGLHHLARYILIGLYTGTRSGAILSMSWLPSAGGGWFDLDRGVMYRAAEGERVTRKRKPPAVIPNRLAAHLRRWKEQDTAAGAILPNVIHWRGRPVSSVKRAWDTATTQAGLPDWVIPHILRHTAITWSVQSGKRLATVSEFFGVTLRELERTYWHHSPEYQEEMRRLNRN